VFVGADRHFRMCSIAGLLTWCGFPERKLLFRGEKYYYRT